MKNLCNDLRTAGGYGSVFAALTGKAAILAAAFATSAAFAGANLIKNGTFEGTATKNSWGSYANQAAFSCSDWTFDQPGRAGLGKPDGTWMAKNLAVGSFGLFMQTGSGEVTVRQSLGALPAGTYRVSTSYTARPSHTGATTYIELVEEGGTVTSVGSVSPTATTLQSFSADVTISAGTYTFRFRQPDPSGDKANCFENVVVRRIEATIGENVYYSIEDAMTAVSSGSNIVWTTDAPNLVLSNTNLVWNGNMPTVNVPGTLTISGANTIASYGNGPGTYTLFSAQSVVVEAGATLALDAPAVTEGIVRTLNIGADAVTLTISLDPARTEMVINNDFDIPGTSAGTVATTAPSWSYSYPRGGFCVPWWNCYSTVAGGEYAGISTANGTWLVTGQTNGGTYSFYGQSYIANTPIAHQDFGTTPAGVYRFSVNYASRSGSYTTAKWQAGIRKSGTVVHAIDTGPISNTKFTNRVVIVAIPLADAYGLQFQHFDGDGSPARTALIDDVSFLRTTVAGWSVADGVTTLSGAAEVPTGSFIDGDAEFASGATLSAEGNHFVPTLTVAGTLTVKGAVTVSLPSAYDTDEASYTLIEAETLAFDPGASLAIDPACATVINGTYTRYAELVVSGNTVYLHMYKEGTSANNYRKSTAECVDTLFSTDANWSREHAPTNGDVNVIFNHSGTVLFDNAYANDAGLNYVFRNGLEAPVVFDATDDAYGFDFKTGYVFKGAGIGSNGYAGWLDFRRGTYAGTYFCLNDYNEGAKNGKFRIDFSGATVNIANCLQCCYSSDCENEVNVSGGVVSMGAAYNTNIKPRGKNRTRITGGFFDLRENLHANAAQNSTLDFEITGGVMEVAGSLYADATVGSFADVRLSGGVIRTDTISLPDGYGRFLFNGGTLAPHAASASWHSGSTVFTVASGKSVIVDTEGKDVTWSATVSDASGGVAYGFMKRGAGTLTFPAAQTFTGTLSMEGGTLLAPVALAASSLYVTNGATFSVSDGTAGQSFTLNALTLEGGSHLAIDLTGETCDSFACGTLDLAGVTVANPVLIVVNAIGVAELPIGVDYTLIASGLSSGDEAKFAVNGIDARLVVVNGALVMRSSNRLKVTTEWSGAANDGGKWTTGGNWTGGEAPQNGDTAAFNLAAGGVTDDDIAGLSLGGLVFGSSAGAFTHAGAETLRVTAAITNLSSNAQTLEMPVVLGVEGQAFEANDEGGVTVTGDVSFVSSSFAKKGAGEFKTTTAPLRAAERIDVSGGTLTVAETETSSETPIAADVVVGDGANLNMTLAGTGDANKLNGSLTIGEGATLSVTPTQPVTFNGAVTNRGTFVQATSNNIYFDGPELVGGTYEVHGNHLWFGGAIDSPESEITLRAANVGIAIFGAQSTLPGTGLPNFKSISVDGTLSEVRFMPRASCEITNNLYDAVVAGANKVLIDSVENAAATVTVKNATWTPKGDFLLSSSNGRGSYLKIGEGGTLNAASVSGKGLYFASGITSPMETILEVAEGGTLNYLGANNYFQIGRGNAASDANALPQRLVVSGGTVNMPTAQLLIGAYARTGYADLTAGRLIVQQLQPRQATVNIQYWGNAYDVRFTQTGGVLELGSGGSMSALPGVDKPYLDLESGTLLATANLSNKYGYMNIQFGAGLGGHAGRVTLPGDGSAPQYTIDLNGKTVTWNAPLAGASDVTITGEGAFNSTAALQSIPLGKWTVTNTTASADLSGAAGFAGGLTVASGKSAKIAVASEGLVEWAMFNNNQIANFAALKAYTGVCPFVNSTLGHVHLSYGSSAAPMGSNSRFIYRGQFHVDADKAGTWYFGVNYDDNISLFIDGTEVVSSTSYNVVGTGSVTLAEGWHDFRVCVLDGSGSCGPYVSGWSNVMGIGWSTDASAEGSTAASAYTKFDTSTLAMRLPQGAATRTAVRMKAAPVSNGPTYMNEYQPFTLLDCVTNNIALLHSYNADTVASVANSQTVHYEGYFLVPEENAGNWVFTGQYDDYISVFIDRTCVIHKAGNSAALSATVSLTSGWHAFRIAVVDGTGSYGGKLKDDNNKVCALKVKPANSAKTLAFDGENFRLAYSAADAQKMCAAGLGGEIDIGADATLQNDVAAGYCPIYGTLKGSGTLSGAFRFTGTTNCWAVTASANNRELARVEFANPTKETFTGLKSLNVTFNGKPTRRAYYLTTATVENLTEADLAGTVLTVTDGERDYSANFTLTVKNGRLALANSKPGGTYIIVR